LIDIVAYKKFRYEFDKFRLKSTFADRPLIAQGECFCFNLILITKTISPGRRSDYDAARFSRSTNLLTVVAFRQQQVQKLIR